MARRSLGQRTFFAAFYVAYLASILLLVHYVIFWRPFVLALFQRGRPPALAPATTPYVDALTAARLGFVAADKRSSFVNFTPAKPSGTVRLCAFGDSHTHGEEVGAAHDFPSLLQDRLRRGGFEHVEVLNFGSGWHGFHQAYIMWESVGTQFDCDYILLGPRCFQPDRDTTFNHTQLTLPYYLHARYVLNGLDVRLIDVLGGTYAERFAEYFRLIPRLRYARYDRNPPAAIQAVIGFGRTLQNPFYYSGATAEDEAYATYAVLLRKMVSRSSQILLLHHAERLIDTAKRLALPNLTAVRMPMIDGLPYKAPQGHESADGNDRTAQRFYAALVDGADASETVLETHDVAANGTPAPAADKPALSSFDSIEVRLSPMPPERSHPFSWVPPETPWRRQPPSGAAASPRC